MNEAQFLANPQNVRRHIKNKNIFIAGCGGLGSNVAMLLVRAGAERFTLCDFDVVSSSNLNRQFFFNDQLQMQKTDALSKNLLRINSNIQLYLLNQKMDFTQDLSPYDIIIECFDKAEYKAQLVQTVLLKYPHKAIISCSGIAGKAPIDELKINKPYGQLIIIGDQYLSPEEGDGTLSTRVMAAAALQAHEAIRILSQ